MAILNPYLQFRDQAREAGEFYRSVFGGELTVMTFGDAGMTEHNDGIPIPADLVMHSQLHSDEGFDLMVADTPPDMDLRVNGDIAISGTEDALLRGYFEKLSEGGTPGVPLETAPWGDAYGQVTDKFGVLWMVNISAQQG